MHSSKSVFLNSWMCFVFKDLLSSASFWETSTSQRLKKLIEFWDQFISLHLCSLCSSFFWYVHLCLHGVGRWQVSFYGHFCISCSWIPTATWSTFAFHVKGLTFTLSFTTLFAFYFLLSRYALCICCLSLIVLHIVGLLFYLLRRIFHF